MEQFTEVISASYLLEIYAPLISQCKSPFNIVGKELCLTFQWLMKNWNLSSP